LAFLAEMSSFLEENHEEFLLTILGVDLMEKADLAWLGEVALPALRTSGRVAVAMTTTEDAARPGVLNDADAIQLGQPSMTEVEEYLARYTSKDVARAQASTPASYGQYKLFAQHVVLGESGSR
jgi:hypothetical protein